MLSPCAFPRQPTADGRAPVDAFVAPLLRSLNGVEVLFAGGQFKGNEVGYGVQYFETDHLGSVRSVVNDSGEVVATNDYYPFGVRHMGGLRDDNIRYKFNGMEEQTTGGLNLLNYGARMYDNELGRWFVQDPLAEKILTMSLYAYCNNNPIMFIDPDGKEADWYMNSKSGELYFNANNTSSSISYKGNLYTRIGNNAMMGSMGTTGKQSFTYQESIDIAKENNYSIVADQTFEKTEITSMSTPTVGGSVSVSCEYKTIINENYIIIPSSQELELKRSETINFGTTSLGTTRAVKRNYYSPVEKTTGKGVLKKIMNTWAALFGGKHYYGDQTPKVYQNWDAYNKYTKNKGDLNEDREKANGGLDPDLQIFK